MANSSAAYLSTTPSPKRRPLVRGLVAIIAMVSTLVFTSGTVAALPAPPNEYAAATVNSGVPSPATPLSPGDCALLIQMTGTIAGGLGQYEILDPATATPTRTYSNTEAVQYVVLPGGCAQQIDVNTAYSPPAWNPATGTGGVVFLGGTTLNLAANIDVSEAGFASGHSVGAGCDGGDGDWGPDGSMWEGGAGGGGIIGGGGGAGAHVGLLFGWNTNEEFDSAPGGGGSATTAGAGGATGDAMGFAPDGGDAGCVGNGGSPDLNVVAGAFYTTGAGAGGGGSYGGGGGACSSRSSGAYSGGGGGGGSYSGGGAGGWEGTNTGYVDPGQPGEAGNAAVGAEITAADHFFHDADPRAIMGGAGGASFQGDGSGPFDGGRGGGIVILAFDAVVGAGGSILANGGNGSTPPNFSGEGSHGSSGSGGGAGGQVIVTSPAVSDTFFSTAGGLGGFAIEDTSSNGNPHTGSTGASGGGGGVWFAGVGPETSNTGPNAGATSADANVTAPGLTNVDWVVAGGSPLFDSFPAPVTVGSSTYTATSWAAIVATANADSAVTFKPIATSLIDASASGFTLADLVARFPWLAQPNNPKNLGLGCGPGLGGTGLVMTSIAPVEIGNYVWLDTNLDGVQDGTEEPLANVDVTLFADDGVTVLGSTTTDTDGLYTFSIAPDTDFVIAVDPSAATAATAINPAILLPTIADAEADDTADSDITRQPDGSLTLTGTSGEPEVNIYDFDAGFVEPDHRIGNLVWLDSDDSGTADVDEPGISGVDVQLFAESGDAAGFDADDPLLGSTTTNTEGNYWFDVLAGTTYYVAIPETQGGTPQVNTDTGLQPVDPAALASSTGITAADSDVDNSDDGDAAEGYLSASGPIVITDDSEPTGETDGNVDPGRDAEAYVEAQPEAVDHDDADSNLTVDLGVVPLPRIGGLLWVDGQFGREGYNDGAAGLTERTAPIGSADVELWEDADRDGVLNPERDTLAKTAQTDASGNYYFAAVKAADYFVAVPRSQVGQTVGKSRINLSGYAASASASNADLGVDNVNVGVATTRFASVSAKFTVALGDNPINEAGDFGDATLGAAEADANTVLGAFTSNDNSDLTIDFGFVKIPTYEIGNLVWNDLDNDGLAEAEEPGIAGVLVELWEDTTGDGEADTLVTSLSTDADGKYNFAELPAGDYAVNVADDQATASNPSALDGYLPSSNGLEGDPNDDVDNNANNSSGLLTVGEGVALAAEPTAEQERADDPTPNESPASEVDARSNLTVDFGYYSLRLGNQVWQDSGAGLNEDNGVFDADEAAIANVTVELWEDADASGDLDPANDTLVDTTTTNGEGNYWFDGLTADTDYIAAVPEAANTGEGEPLFGQRSSVGQSGAADTDDNDDNDDDGAPDAATGYAAVATPVTVNAGTAPTGETDTVPAGDDAEVEANAAGTPTVDSNSNLHVDFGFTGIPTYEIGNLVWNDIDNDGLAEAGEPGIAGVLVELWEDTTGDGTADTLVTWMSTDADGKYNFAGLLEGDYVVALADDQATATDPTALDGLVPTSTGVEADPNTNIDNDSNNAGADSAAPDSTVATHATGIIELGDGVDFSDEPAGEQERSDDATANESPTGLRDDRSNLSIDFGFYQVSLGNQLWNDVDNNGEIDTGETPIEGATVELWEDTTGDGVFDPATDTLVESTTTDPSGLYLFDGLAEGDYVVVIPASEFADGALLDGHMSSDPTETDPNDGVDGNDNGIFQADGAVASGIVELRAGDAPTDETPDNDPTTPDVSENLTVDFGFYQLRLGNQVFADIGAGPNEDNGVFDTDEFGIENVQVELWIDTDDSGDLDPSADELVDTTVTDPSGNYFFDALQDDETYLVAIPDAGNAGTGEALEATGSSTATSTDPNAADNDDDGAPAADYRAVSGPVTVDAGNEAIGEIDTNDSVRADAEADADAAGTTVPDANSNMLVDFGFVTPPIFEIGNLVWADDNNNGVVDAGEAGIEGVEVELWRDTNAAGVGDVLVDTETTDANGQYLFDMVYPGDYVVVVPTAPENLVSSTGAEADPNADVDNNDNGIDALNSSGILTVGEGVDIADEPTDEADESPTGLRDDRSNLTVDFGFYGLSLGNQVWHDVDNNGLINADEPALAGVAVNLWEDTSGDGVANALVDTTTTDVDGLYLFEGLAEGSYIVEVPAMEFEADASLDGLVPSDGLVLEPSNTIDGLTNGESQDDGSTQTGVIELSAGTAPTAEDPSNDANPADANSNLTVDLGFYGLELGNSVFFDTDVDGAQDADEPGAAGVEVNLWSDVDSDGEPDDLVDSTVTDTDGNYLFTGLAEGDYIVELPASNFDDGAALDGWVSSTGGAEEPDPNADVDGNDNGIDPVTPGEAVLSGAVTLSALDEPDGSTNLTVDFGFYNLSLGNRIWEDVNNNGLVDDDENGIAGVVVELFTDADGDGEPDDLDGDDAPDPIQTVITDVDGFYDFDGLLPGTYVVGVPAENFVDGAVLSDMTSSTPTTEDPEDDEDSDDNGIDPAVLGSAVYSLPIELAANSEPTNDEPPASGLGGLDDDSNLTIDFGFFVIPLAGGAVWHDADENGQHDADEDGMTGIEASLIDSDGDVVSSATTDDDGIYAFDVVEPGTYTVEFDPNTIPQGYASATISCPPCAEGNVTTSVLGANLTSPPFEIAGGSAGPTVSLSLTQIDNGVIPAALAFTGSTISSILMLAFILLVAGSVFALVGRRRRDLL